VKQNLFVRFAVCILLFFAVSAAFAYQMPQPFSADFSTTSANGNANMKGKFFFSLAKVRMDMTDTGQRQAAGPFGGKMSMIMDGDAKMAYMLMPDQQMYMEFPTNANNPMTQRQTQWQDFKGDPCTFSKDQGATCKKLGTETVNGRSCDKWEVTEKSGRKETLWIDQKLHFPIRMTDGQITSDFTNIKEGAQDASLFKVPAGYRKFDASMMGGQRPH
jgi:outer membrane lipoprotein-sorting protein